MRVENVSMALRHIKCYKVLTNYMVVHAIAMHIRIVATAKWNNHFAEEMPE